MSSAADGYLLPNSLELTAQLRDLEVVEVGQLAAYAAELRAWLSHDCAMPPERLAEALAAVDLAIAVHHVFNTSFDRIVWDGGHDSRAHRWLSGRHPGGPQVSPDDGAGAGRCGSAIGAALGMAVAAAHRGEQHHVVAIVPDGALTAGMAFEALNHAGALPAHMLVILNDSDPAHAGSGSALSNQLAKVLSGPVYTQLRAGGKKALRQMPTVRELARRSELHLKGMVLPGTLFEELGFNYIGPLDGHNIGALVATLQNLKRVGGPQFLHVLTRRPAPAGSPVATTGCAEPGGRLSYDEVCGQWLCEMAETDPRLMVVTPAALEASGLQEFARRFPQRCFDVSIAQQHAVTFAAGLAAAGLRPVVAISSASLQRAYDQLIHDVALQRLPVMFALHHAGVVGGEPGPDHGA